LRLQNDSALALSRAGYRVYQNPGLAEEERLLAGIREGKNPDLILEGRVFDVYSPTTEAVGSITNSISEKIAGGQTSRVVVSLASSTVSRVQLARALRQDPIPGLREAIVIDGQGDIRHAYP
jgi:hypothetical protein